MENECTFKFRSEKIFFIVFVNIHNCAQKLALCAFKFAIFLGQDFPSALFRNLCRIFFAIFFVSLLYAHNSAYSAACLLGHCSPSCFLLSDPPKLRSPPRLFDPLRNLLGVWNISRGGKKKHFLFSLVYRLTFFHNNS